MSGFDDVFRGVTTASQPVWREAGPESPGWEYTQWREEEYYRYTDPRTRKTFQGVGLERVRAAVRDARSVTVLQINLGDGTAFQPRYFATDTGKADGQITGVYLREGEYPEMGDIPACPAGWNTPQAMKDNANGRGYGQYATNFFADLEAHKSTAVTMRYDKATDSFNLPVPPLPF